MILWIISELLGAYSFILLIRVALSWVSLGAPRWHPRGIVYELIKLVYKVTDPPINFFNRFIAPVRFGNIGIDMGFLVVYCIVIMLQILVKML